MAQPPHDRDPNAPQNPPRSVLNKDVRRTALRTYLLPLLLFFTGAAVVLVYLLASPRPVVRDDERLRVEGTSGTEGERSRGDETPGGHNPDRRPDDPRREVQDRSGRVITELGEVFEENSRGTIGRRVELRDIDVERVDSPTLFWIRDGNARIAVVAPTESGLVRAGQSITVFGTVERSGNEVRIRASELRPSR